jgi:hypothetical protein
VCCRLDSLEAFVRHLRRFLLVTLITSVSACADNTLTSSLAPSEGAARISNGTPTGASLYTNVGNLFADTDGDGPWDYRCTGTLVSATAFLTAGHCIEPGATYYVTFAPVALPAPEPLDESALISSTTAFRHPDWQFPYFDVAVIVFDATEVAGLGITPMPVTPLGFLTEFRTQPAWGQQAATVVGYGLASAGQGPYLTQNDGVRRYADVKTQQLNDYFLVMHENAPKAGKPGTCPGDSGGPVILGGYLVAVNSYGLSAGCHNLGGYVRIDTPEVLDWLSQYL